ncbi:DUF4158 domain-containing protein [Paenibacillus sp. N5-1-1-5]|uniref:DUF4158 domain-containing protein n=1 Tax=Paenibacillus radicis (ex Xue et al. 2023) TaxID=2972489 RepID=A0ABT1YCU5_9BACL|nr:DUF4158 domain-containing protein [Paenibacillus radicis (ex Xue et al. 2023)]MCR8630590.1 DUF4158 domain-containing protein [Paenibacillus radicis (ex Xue et al. 2023)]
MYVRVRELLTSEERMQYLQIPPDLGEWELGTYFTFTQDDLESGEEIIIESALPYSCAYFAISAGRFLT